MSIKKVDMDNQDRTYSSYVIAEGFVFSSICSGFGETVTKATETALNHFENI